ncbi:MAG TPA: TonB-dependent receptor [Selenomonadales bacterium]|nr:TonB-dependent receptor [Selenomonadales bacterium]
MSNKTFRKKIMAAVAAGALLWADGAWAEEDVTFQLDQVTVTAERVAQTVGSTPANVTVLSGEELQRKGARTLSDALTGVSGVVVQQYGGAGQKAVPYILGTDRVVLLIDGKRMNLPQGIGVGSGGIDANAILLGGNIDRIEVVRGGASTLYGADAVGGVINIITKKGDSSTPTIATAAGGNHGGRYYGFDTGGQDQNTRWQLSGSRESNDGQRANSAYEGKNLSFRLDQDLAKSESLTFTYDYYDSHAGLPGSLAWPSPGDYQDILRRNWSMGYAKEHADGSRMVRYYDNDQRYSGVNSGVFRHKNTVRAFEYQDSARWNAANLLTWGGEWRKDKVVSTGEGGVPRDGTTKAIFLQDQYSFNAAAKLTVGLRRDESSLYGTHWLPQAAYLYQANANTSYFANWAKVFKAPKFDDLYGDDGWGNTGDPNLEPETGWTAEAGVKTRINAATEATASVFRRNITDAIRWTADPDFTYHPHNIDRYKATGLNASLVSKLSPATTADVGYTYLDGRDQNDRSIGDPRHSFHVGFHIQEGKLSQTVYGVYQDQTGTAASRVGGRCIVNTNTSYALNEDTTLFLTVSNLFDKQYQAVNGYPANGRTFLLGVKQTL